MIPSIKAIEGVSARLAHLPAMMLTYAAQMRGLLADHDTPTGLIWEMWVNRHFHRRRPSHRMRGVRWEPSSSPQV